MEMGVLQINRDKPLKTLGPQAARLIAELHERGKTLFSHADVEEITSLQAKSARNFVASLVQRGVVTRLKPGLFILVPFELGRERDYLGTPTLSRVSLRASSITFCRTPLRWTFTARNEPRDLRRLVPDLGRSRRSRHAHFRDRRQARGPRPQPRHTMGEEFKKKEARYKRLWSTRLSSQMAELPPFDDVFRSVRRSLRAAELIPRT